MNIKIEEARELTEKALKKMGFSNEEAKISANNLIEAELCGRKTHGMSRVFQYQKFIDAGRISPSDKEVEVEKETPVSVLVNGFMKPGGIVEMKALELALKKVKQSGIVMGGTTNAAPTHGFIGHYARIAAENDLIYIGFHNSDSFTIPFGSSEALWGTNPITVAIPSTDKPVILDMASTKTTWGTILVAKLMGKEIPEGLALDKEGNPSTNPENMGGLLPFEGQKGSGLAFVGELLAGTLTNSKTGKFKQGGWGGLFILIDPNLFRPIDEFKKDVTEAIKELKGSRKAQGVEEIFYPGEHSLKLREELLTKSEIEIDESLYAQIKDFISIK